MAEVICLSSDEEPTPPPRPPRAAPSDDDSESSDSELATTTGRPAKAPRVSKPAEGGPPRASTRAPALRAPSAETAARAAERTTERAAERARKAEEARVRREAAIASKKLRADERERRVRSSGRHKLRQITAACSTTLAEDSFGRVLRAAFDQGVKDDAGTRGVVSLLHREEPLPMPRSVTWRYHDPSEEPVGPSNDARASDESNPPSGVSTRPALYTLVHLTGERFADMCVADFDAGFTGASNAKTDPPPPDGLEALIRSARASIPRDTLAILVEGLESYCLRRERREHKTLGVNGFTRAPVDRTLARFAAIERGVRVHCVPDLEAAKNHVLLTHVALARRPFTREEGLLDIIGHKAERGFSAGAALEAHVAAASFERGTGGSQRGTTTTTTTREREVPDSQASGIDPPSVGGAAGAAEGVSGSLPGGAGGGARSAAAAASSDTRRQKSQAETWASALMKIDMCSEPVALAIVRAFPTMAGLMRAYRDPSASERRKELLLADLVRVNAVPGGTARAEGRKVGPVVSARVFRVLGPKREGDAGDELVGKGL